MYKTLTKEELIAIGVNTENLIYHFGEMNIIVQSFGYENGTREELNINGEYENIPIKTLTPDIYHPRKNSVWSCGCNGDKIPFETKEDKDKWIIHLRDSAERLKIMSYYLSKQADEIEKFGYPKTTCYYPE